MQVEFCTELYRRNGATRFVLFAQFAEGNETKRTENETGGTDEKTVSSGD
jgi:hypothetical protein